MRSLSKKLQLPEAFIALSVELHKNGKTLVQCDGVFDLVHPGHIEYFRIGKALGDFLYVVIVADKFVQKGPGRPLFDELTRAKWIAALECVDYVVINQDYGPLKLIERIRPHVLVKGRLYETQPTNGFTKDRLAVEDYGGRVEFVDELQRSSDIISRIYDLFN